MPKESQNQRCAELWIAGMTCSSCEIMLERKLKKVPGVLDVEIDHRSGKATIMADVAHLPSAKAIESVIENAGYGLADAASPDMDARQKWKEIGGSLLVIFVLYKLLQVFDLVSLAPSVSGTLTFGGIFFIGLVAGTSSCLAVTGGLLLSLAAKHNEIHQGKTPWHKFKTLLHFNIGRLASYFFLGGLTGLLGNSITLSTKTTGYLNIIVAMVMLSLALSILKVIPKGSFPIRPPKKLSHWIAGLSESDHPAAPFSLGILTFFLPCGFTQSLQLLALASQDFLQGSLIMFTFALGTLPALLGISAISSSAKGSFSGLFLRFSGALVLLLSIFNLNSGFALLGIDIPQSIAAVFQGERRNSGPLAVKNGNVQELFMRVRPGYYEPNRLSVRAGIPVRWTIDGTEAQGCTSVLVIPDLDIVKPLSSGMNIIEFTPPSEPGQLAFSCSMGMVRGSITVL